jgi:DNA repair photolyase
MKDREVLLQKLGEKVSGTKEWANTTVNIQRGCPNGCIYCYAGALWNLYRNNGNKDWTKVIYNQSALFKKIRKRKGRIMFPSSHDITRDNLEVCVEKLREMLKAGNIVVIVSKPDPFCIQSICNKLFEYKDNIIFRFTIGSLDSEVLKFWEPNAPSFEERLSALRYAYNNGFNTSVSCEPMLDDKSAELAERLLPYVTDTLWFGKANRLKCNLSLNGFKDESTWKKADELIAMHSDEYIQKLYEKFKDNSRIRWKESIKKIVGIPLAETAGLDK